jgi:hypothetical protein
VAGFKDPSFQERTAAAARAKAKALEGLRAKPVLDEATLAERAARNEAREAAEAEKRAAKQAAKEAAEAAKQAAAQAAAEAKAAASENAKLSEADKKAARDARYAARKARK